MKQHRFLCGTAAFLIVAGGAAQADVTSAQVWDAWKAMAQESGQTISAGSESQDGGTLTVTDVTLSMETTDVSASGAISSIVFSEQGDGTVSIEVAPSYDLNVSVDPEDGSEDVDLAMQITHDGLSMIASGDPDAVTYDYQADTMTVTFTELTVDGETMEMDGDLTMSTLAGTYTAGADGQMSTSGTVGKMAIVFHMDEPDDGDGTIDANLEYNDVTLKSDGAMALMAGGVKELSSALAGGASSSTSISHGAASYSLDFVDGSDNFSMNGTAESGLFEIGLSADALSYDIGNTGLDFVVTGSDIPLPEIAMTMGEFGFGLMMPVSKSAEPQDFSFGLTLADLGVSDMIWAMIDQGGQLPHDPATIILDLSGKANFLFDLFDPDSMAMVDSEMPAEIHALDINQMRLAVAGADLTGTGSFTFDMDNLETFEGVPAPTGKLSLTLVGANALLDKLVAMGLIPEDQAMGARMMMGLFARPGDGEDTLQSDIEIDGATGAVSANGQRLQ